MTSKEKIEDNAENFTGCFDTLLAYASSLLLGLRETHKFIIQKKKGANESVVASVVAMED